MIPKREFICLECGAPRTRFWEIRTGEHQYAPCECGAIGLERANDNYLAPIERKKKSNVEPYERSRYRGGKLHT